MQIDLFPEVQKSKFDEEQQKEIEQAEIECKNKVDNIKNSAPNAISDDESLIYGAMAGGIIGLLVGFVVCLKVVDYSDSFLGGIGTWIICAFVGSLMGLLIFDLFKSVRDKKIEENENNQNTQRNILKESIEEIENRYRKKNEEYIKAFELIVQRESVKFAESKLATEVIEWITKGFSETIDASDRSSHISKIEVPYIIKVYSNKITCNLGTYDFQIKRCRELSSHIEQAALARAIASSIRLRITMKYPKDASGTDITIDIDYEYSTDYASAVISYKSPNGNYRPVEDWN